MKKNNKKGFTLAELLIVVAIIGVLVAISIPIFTTQLEKAREATDAANIRAAYAAVSTSVLTEPKNSAKDANGVTYKADSTKGDTYTAYVTAVQTQDKWQSSADADKLDIGGKEVDYATTSGTNKAWKIEGNVKEATVTITAVTATE